MKNYEILSPEELNRKIDNSIYALRVHGRREYEEREAKYYRYDRWLGEPVLETYTQWYPTDRCKVDGETYDIKGACAVPFSIYYSDNGYLKNVIVFPTKVEATYEMTDRLREKHDEFIETYVGSTIDSFVSIPRYDISKFLDGAMSNNGENLLCGTIRNEFKTYFDKNLCGRGYMDKDEKTRWLALSDEAKHYIVCIDRNYKDICPTGFSVRLLLKSDKSFQEQKQFVKTHRKDILQYVMNEIPHTKKIMRRIGDLKFYKPVEIILLRSNELDIKFEVKGELANDRT